LLVLAAIVASTGLALAEGKPSWSGGGRGGGGKPSAPDLYGDMVLIDRTVDGVPITTLGLGPKDQWVQVPQPIMLGPKVDCPLWNLTEGPFVGEDTPIEGLPGLEEIVDPDSIYTQLDGITAYHIPFVEGEIPADYGTCSTEADFGRLSSARSPDEVVDHSLLEMVTTLSNAVSAGGQIFLDAAGRLAVQYPAVDDLGNEIIVEKTIDAPLENLAAFERILEAAELFHASVNGGAPVVLPVYPGGHGPNAEANDLLDRAAAMIGAAGDKSGYVGMDEIVYLTLVRTIAADMSGEARTMFGQPPETGYFNFGKFDYDRSKTYDGTVCYFDVVSPTSGPGETDTLPQAVTGDITKGSILQLVFPPLDEGEYVGGLVDAGDYTNFTGSNVWAFARAADDARAVIDWVHAHPVPEELADYCKLDMGP